MPPLTLPRRKVSPQPFHLMAKPSGPACNLDCTYCFYLEKDALFPPKERYRMSESVVEAYVRNYIESHPPQMPVLFAWQGGEPTLMGLDFFRMAVAFQHKYGVGRVIENSLQTNGTLLDDAWAEFLAENKFLIGISIDGPAEYHDAYRVTKDHKPTHHLVLRGLAALQRHKVDYNVLACVNRLTARHPLEVYRFLREQGVEFIQFIPIIERPPEGQYVQLGLSLHGPAKLGKAAATAHENPRVTEWSVDADDYGNFMCAIFDEWVKADVGRIYVMNFEWALANFMGVPGAVCVHQKTCGRAVIIEHNGDVYSCDHFMYPEYRLGNVQDQSLATMLDSPQQVAFGNAKFDTLPKQCRTCPVLGACWGGCPKHRFITTADGEPGLNYLCAGYKHFFLHIRPQLKVMSDLLRAERPPADIMKMSIVVQQ